MIEICRNLQLEARVYKFESENGEIFECLFNKVLFIFAVRLKQPVSIWSIFPQP